MWSSIHFSSCGLGIAPLCLDTISPLWYRNRAGIPLTPSFAALAGLVSVSTFAIKISLSPATCSKTGAIALHGPHHGAQKSTRTHSLLPTDVSNSESVTARTSPICPTIHPYGGGIMSLCEENNTKSNTILMRRYGLGRVGQHMIIAPSILTAELSNLAVACKQALDSGLDRLHLDIMDGNFVPNLTFGPPVIKSLRNALGDEPFFDAHLMISNAEECYMDYIEAGCDHLSVHLEAATHIHRLVTAIREAGASVGVVINPGTPIDGVLAILNEIDLVLVMSVNPGFGGQSFIPSVETKIRKLKQAIDNQVSNGGRPVEIQIDGGIKAHNIGEIASWGVTNFVVGSGLFNDKASVTENLQHIISSYEQYNG